MALNFSILRLAIGRQLNTWGARRGAVWFGLALVALVTGCASAPVGFKKSGPDVFYPPLPEKPRLQFFMSMNSEDDFGKRQTSFDKFLLGEVESERRFARPYDIASAPGKIYVLDRLYRKIIIVNLDNRRFSYLDDSGAGKLEDPSGIWVTPDDIKYVADMARKQIVVFGKNNEYLRTYGSKTVFDRPTDVAVYGNSIFVCDALKNQVLVLDSQSGDIVSKIGETGSKEGMLNKPPYVSADGRGNVYVTDAFNFRVQKFNPSGELTRVYGFQGDMLGSFARPKGISVDRDGRLYVVDAAFENVQIFDDQARLLLFFGGSATKPGDPGAMSLPAGVHIDYDNVKYFEGLANSNFKISYLVYVANMYGDVKLSVYGFGEWGGADAAVGAVSEPGAEAIVNPNEDTNTEAGEKGNGESKSQ